MINKRLKKLLLLTLILSLGHISTFAQLEVSKLNIADSLFKDQKFTESFELYESILKEHGKYSKQMLLKMAFIKEGLRDYSNALYYLNLYYLQTSDKKVLKKMEKLAKEQELIGYEYSDKEFFLMLYRKYNHYITYFLTALSILFFSALLRQKFRLKKQPFSMAIALTIIMGLLFYHINFSKVYSKGIIISEQSYLMESPSSSANLVEIIEKGHRVNVINKQDVWVEIEWDGNIAFIRENNIATIQ